MGKVKHEIIAALHEIRKKIEETSFEVKDIDEIRREVGKLEVLVHNKLIEAEIAEKRSIHNADVFICRICGKEFLKKESINAHLIRHHKVRPSEEHIDRLKFPDYY